MSAAYASQRGTAPVRTATGMVESPARTPEPPAPSSSAPPRPYLAARLAPQRHPPSPSSFAQNDRIGIDSVAPTPTKIADHKADQRAVIYRTKFA
jgi:hypothetical protein